MKIHTFTLEVCVEDVADEGSEVCHERLLSKLTCSDDPCTCNIGFTWSELKETVEDE